MTLEMRESNIDDTAWQHAGGDVTIKHKKISFYSASQREHIRRVLNWKINKHQ